MSSDLKLVAPLGLDMGDRGVEAGSRVVAMSRSNHVNGSGDFES